MSGVFQNSFGGRCLTSFYSPSQLDNNLRRFFKAEHVSEFRWHTFLHTHPAQVEKAVAQMSRNACYNPYASTTTCPPPPAWSRRTHTHLPGALLPQNFAGVGLTPIAFNN